ESDVERSAPLRTFRYRRRINSGATFSANSGEDCCDAAECAVSSDVNSWRSFCTEAESRTLNIRARARPRSDTKCRFKGSTLSRSDFGNSRLNVFNSLRATSRSRESPRARHTILSVGRIRRNDAGRDDLNWRRLASSLRAATRKSCNSSGLSPRRAPGSWRCQADKYRRRFARATSTIDMEASTAVGVNSGAGAGAKPTDLRPCEYFVSDAALSAQSLRSVFTSDWSGSGASVSASTSTR